MHVIRYLLHACIVIFASLLAFSCCQHLDFFIFCCSFCHIDHKSPTLQVLVVALWLILLYHLSVRWILMKCVSVRDQESFLINHPQPRLAQCLIASAFFSLSAFMTVSYIWLHDLPAVVRQSSSSLLSWQLSWPLHKKLRSTQWPFRHLKRASEHTSGLPVVVEWGQRSSVKC